MYFDPSGVARVVLPDLTFAHLLDVALDQIVHYDKGDPAVSIRVQRALADIAAATTDPGKTPGEASSSGSRWSVRRRLPRPTAPTRHRLWTGTLRASTH
jgi:hypothetical protein